MKKKEVDKRWIFLGAFIFLLLVIIGFLFLEPKFTGFVVGPEGQECDGDWACGDWGDCINENQTRDCTSDNSLNCTSPITELQSCVVECAEDWICTDWTACVDGNQTRTCEDSNACGTEDDKPGLLQSCVVECAEDWICTDWTACADSLQSRECADSALCGTNTTRPDESQSCTMPSVCGDGDCNGAEDCDTCSDDCGACSEEESTVQVPVTASITSEETITTTCTPGWQCGEWDKCEKGVQSRTCNDVNACGTENGKPEVFQTCEVIIEETCFDELQNQDEEGIDCGGVCEQKCKRSIFSLVGNVVRTPLDSGKQFLVENKTISFSILGVLVFVAGGVITYIILKKKKQLGLQSTKT